jgi:thiopeptide-type bacteriocin biosynthesis protein
MTDEIDWLYYRIYLPGLGEIRDVVENVVAPSIRKFTAAHPSLKWFFLQYIDQFGFQLRLRLNASAPILASLEPVLDARFAEAIDDPRVGGGPDRIGTIDRPIVKRLYEPEYAKFGGPEGVALAQKLMQIGSETALCFAQPRYRPKRILLGAAHTHLMVGTLPEAEQTSFLHHYAWYWSARGRHDAPWRPQDAVLAPNDPATRRRAVRLARQVEAVLTQPEDRSTLAGYTDRFWSTVRAFRPERSEHLIAAHHIHLMNNRLGLVPAEEMRIARLLWLARLQPPTAKGGPGELLGHLT